MSASHSASRHAAGHRAPSTVTPVQFIPPEQAREPEQHSTTADHSDATMRTLRTPFDPS